MALTPGMAAGGKAMPSRGGLTKEERKVIFASSLGTVFEWYDFYLYGSLAAIIAKQFFVGDPTTSFIFALLAFAAGFLVRPFGALVFGRLGDLVGRKYTFLITILTHGWLDLHRRPAARLRVLGHRRADHPGHAAHPAGPGAGRRVRRRRHLCRGARAPKAGVASSPPGSRPRPRSACSCRCSSSPAYRAAMDTQSFDAWGWRIPFLVSVLLLAISVWDPPCRWRSRPRSRA